ncbi:ABC transporter substrate-binding protein [Sporolactobacillus shoreicorticis]|uniref:ABC transporter substrate-binding protein n=1 Tax=Sporolactobacillus shoreicorticis TaxID=1923877 RepID=A0ABW5S1V5_9BACL|nr:ABC transporter substrate-binding protein [Sporolactobacillus shoreicorticis]MCO7126541.1 ABC transporter substrate-binding protein [Sporolactobacillus shoreicorticis]
MQKPKRTIKGITVLLLIAALVLLSACGNASSDKKGKTRDSIYLGMVNPPAGFNPINNGDQSGFFSVAIMFDPLLDMTEPLKFEPKLADSMKTTDNQNYTIVLNSKAKWTDGQSITADDVIFTFNLIANPKSETAIGFNISSLEGLDSNGKLKNGLSAIPNLKKIDAHTVSFKTKDPIDPNYIKEMIGTKIFTLPQHVLKDIAPEKLATSKFMTAPSVTSGAYQFVKYSKNTFVEYKANNDYYLGKPKIPRLFLKILPASNIAAELQSGAIQMNGGGDLPIQDVAMVKKMKGIKTSINPQTTFQTMMFNTKNLPDKNVRQALAYAIDRQKIVDKLLKGYGEINDGPYTKLSPYLDKRLKKIAYNPEKAKQMLKASGWDSSRTLNLVVPIGNVVRQQSADLIVQNLKAIGVKVKETTYDFPTIMQKGKQADFDLLLIGLPMNVDPDTNYYYTGSSYNFMGYSSRQSDRLLEEGKKETRSAKRKEIYSELQALWQEDMPMLTLYAPDQIACVSKDLAFGGIAAFWPGTLHELHQWAYKNQ